MTSIMIVTLGGVIVLSIKAQKFDGNKKIQKS